MYLLGSIALFLLCWTRNDAKDCNGRTLWTSGLQDGNKQEILDYHNKFRDMVAAGTFPGMNGNLPAGKNMRKLEWCDDCAMLAQQQADKCVFDHGNFQLGTTKYAQVISGFYQTTQEEVSTANWTRALDNLVDESKKFDVNRVTDFKFTDETGHFTIMSTGKADRVGCGFSAFLESNDTNTPAHSVYYCNYLPLGIVGEPLYAVGEPCSICKCDETYTHLCKDAPKESSTTGGDPNGASGDPNGASGDPNGASGDPNGASGDPNGASGDPNGASGDPNGVSGS